MAYVTDHLAICLSVGLSACLSAKCTVAKRLSGSGCHWDCEWGRSRYGCISWGSQSLKGKGSFGGEFGVFHCNQWELCDAAFHELLWTGLVFWPTVLSVVP